PSSSSCGSPRADRAGLGALLDLAAGSAGWPYPGRVASRAGAGKDGRVKYWEDFVVGERSELGSCSITEAEVLAFARKYDPQPFHTDPEAARRSIYGGLI